MEDVSLKVVEQLRLGPLEAAIVVDPHKRRCVRMTLAGVPVLFTANQALLVKEILALSIPKLLHTSDALEE